MLAPLPPSAYRLRQEPLWLPAGVLAALLMLTMAISAAGAPAPSFDADPRTTGPSLQWRARGTTKMATKPTELAAKPNVLRRDRATVRRDRRVVRVHHHGERHAEAPSPRPQRGAASWLSIVETGRVEPGRHSEPAVRTAQFDEPDFGAELQEQLEEPFGGAEELPPQPDTPLPDVIEDRGVENPAEPESLPGLGDFDTTDPAEAPAQAFDEQFPSIDQQGETPSADEGSGSRERGATDESPSDEPDEGSGSRGGFDVGDLLSGPESEAVESDREDSGKSGAASSCAEELAKLKASSLTTIDLYIGVNGEVGRDYPYTCSIDDGTPFAPRAWAPVTYTWKASALCHKPLYFEQKSVERYGHSWGPYFDPLVAGAHFFTRLPVLPYCMGLKAPNECVYTLGHYRPGSCAPYLIEQPGFTWRAAAFEAGAWVGGVLLVP